ncbi:MAG: TonB-dependent receptor [Gemmatimonadetes bacterium]|nr:TonB-dependent receptor [Gemmatimonadota bacterium]
MRKERVEASLGLYTIDYNNRLIGVAVCPLTATCVSSFANVGGVSTRGAEALLSFRLADGLSWVNSAAFNDSKIDNDYKSGTTTVASSGKTVVDAPRSSPTARCASPAAACSARSAPATWGSATSAS